MLPGWLASHIPVYSCPDHKARRRSGICEEKIVLFTKCQKCGADCDPDDDEEVTVSSQGTHIGCGGQVVSKVEYCNKYAKCNLTPFQVFCYQIFWRHVVCIAQLLRIVKTEEEQNNEYSW